MIYKQRLGKTIVGKRLQHLGSPMKREPQTKGVLYGKWCQQINKPMAENTVPWQLSLSRPYARLCPPCSFPLILFLTLYNTNLSIKYTAVTSCVPGSLVTTTALALVRSIRGKKVMWEEEAGMGLLKKKKIEIFVHFNLSEYTKFYGIIAFIIKIQYIKHICALPRNISFMIYFHIYYICLS